jgi:hypothetical protein
LDLKEILTSWLVHGENLGLGDVDSGVENKEWKENGAG